MKREFKAKTGKEVVDLLVKWINMNCVYIHENDFKKTKTGCIITVDFDDLTNGGIR